MRARGTRPYEEVRGTWVGGIETDLSLKEGSEHISDPLLGGQDLSSIGGRPEGREGGRGEGGEEGGEVHGRGEGI